MVPLKQHYLHYASEPYEYASQPIQNTQQLVTIPQNSLQYTIPSTQYYPVQYTNQQASHHQTSPNVQIQQSIEYPTQYTSLHTNKYTSLSPPSSQLSLSFDHNSHNANINSYGPSLDFFGTHNKHSSLLDSYIPSSVILERQKSLQHNARPLSSLTYNNGALPSSTNNHLTHSIGNNGYNTIAYSIPHKYDGSNHLKRSTAKSTILQQSSKTTKLKKSV